MASRCTAPRVEVIRAMFDSSQFWSVAVAKAPGEHAIWLPCAICWGQRRIFEEIDGEGLVPHTCDACLGLGERLAAV